MELFVEFVFLLLFPPEVFVRYNLFNVSILPLFVEWLV